MPLTSSDLKTVNACIINHVAWSYTDNCSSFVSGLWNSVFYVTLNAGVPNTPSGTESSINSWGMYITVTDQSLSHDYIVHYAHGTGAPKPIKDN